MRPIKELIFPRLPKRLQTALRFFRRSWRGWADRLYFPFWLVLQCAAGRKRAVVIWRIAALGDVICTLPLALAIKQAHPDRLLIYVTSRGFRKAVEFSRIPDRVYAINHPYGTPSWMPFASAASLGLIDKVYEPLTTDERCASDGPRCHLVEDLANSCGFTLTNLQPRLYPPAEIVNAIQTAHSVGPAVEGKWVIGINGGHSWPVKEWDASKWQHLVDRIHACYDAVVLQFGLSYAPGIYDPNNHLKNVRSVVSRLSCEEIIGLVASCDLVVTIDSGPLHVAGAVGTPVVGLFGANDPKYRLPPEGRGLGIVHDVPCLFCHHRTPIEHWRTGCPYDIRCMKLLEPETVFAAVVEMLERPPAG